MAKTARIKYDCVDKKTGRKFHNVRLDDGQYRRNREIQIPAGAGSREKQVAKDEALKVKLQLEKEYEDFLEGRSPELLLSVAVAKYMHEEVMGNKPGGKEQKASNSARYKLLVMEPYYRDRYLHEIVDVVEKFKEGELNRRIAASTINASVSRFRQIAKQAFQNKRWTYEDGRKYLDKPLYVEILDVPYSKEDSIRNAPEDFFTYNALMEIVDACEDQEAKDFILVGLFTGMRETEVYNINAPQERMRKFNHNGVEVQEKPYVIDWSAGCIRLPDQKNNKKNQSIPIIGQAEQALRRSFPCTRHISWYLRRFTKAAKAVGNDYAYFHMVRKSTGSILLNDLKVPIEVISKILRHKTLQQTISTYVNLHHELHRQTLEGFAALEERRQEAKRQERMRLSKKADEDENVA